MNKPMGVAGYCLLLLVDFEMVAFKSQPPLAGIVHVYSKKKEIKKQNQEKTIRNSWFRTQN